MSRLQQIALQLLSQLFTVCVYCTLLIILCLPQIIDKEMIRHQLTDLAAQTLTLPLEASSLKLSFFPHPFFQVKDLGVRISEEVEVELDSLRILPSWRELLLGRTRLFSLQLDNPVVTFHPDRLKHRFPPDRETVKRILRTVSQISKSSIKQGCFQIKTDGKTIFSLDDVSLETQSSGLLKITASGASNFCQRFSLKLGTDPKTLDLQGELEISKFETQRLIALLPGPHQESPPGLLDLSGSLTMTSGFIAGLTLNASDFRIQPVRKACLSLSENQTLHKVLAIVRSGWVPSLSIKTGGESPRELIENLRIEGRMKNGEIMIPKPEMHLTGVNGSVRIQDKILHCTGAQATYERSKAWNGELTLGLNSPADPFSLKTELSADFSRLPEVLAKTIDSKQFAKRLKLFTNVSGQGQGLLKIYREDSGVCVEADLQQGKVAAEYDPLSVPLKIGPARLLWTKPRIRLKGTALELGRSRFSTVSLEVFRKKGPNRFRVTTADADLDLGQILPEILSLADREGHLKGATPRGRANLDTLSAQGVPGHPESWDLFATGEVHDLLLKVEGFPPPLRFASGGFVVSTSGLSLTNWKTECLDASSTLSGNIKGIAGNAPSSEFTFQNGSFGPEFLAALETYLPLPPKTHLQAPLNGTNGAFALHGTSLVSFRAEIKAGPTSLGVTFQNHPQRSMHCKFKVLDELSKASLEIEQSSTGLLDIHFTGHLLQKSVNAFLQTSSYHLGNVLGYLSLRFSPKPFLIRSAQGRLHLRDTVLQVEKGQKAFRLDNLILKARDKKILIRRGRFHWGSSPGHLRGAVDFSGNKNILAAVIHTRRCTWEEIEQIFSSQFVRDPNETRFSRVKARITFSADSFHFKDLVWKPLVSTVNIQTNRKRIRLSPRSKLCTVQTAGSVVLQNKGMRIDLKQEAEQEDLDRTLNCLFGWEKRITGHFDLEGNLKGKATDLEDLKDSLQGGISLSARNGRIYRFTILAKILELLNTTEILFGNPPDLEKQGFAYNKLSIACKVEDSKLIIKGGHLDGQSMEIDFLGSYDPASREIELTLAVAPLKTVDRILQAIPILRDITGKSLISIPLKISGTLDHHRIIPLPPKAVGKGFLEFLKNTVQLPVKIIQPLVDAPE